MDQFSSYTLIIGATVMVLLAFLFSNIAKRTNVPAVLLLLALGVGLHYFLVYVGRESIDFYPFIKILGTIGLFVIVLDGSLKLELRRAKGKIILRSFLVALLGLGVTTGLIATILHYSLAPISWAQACLYAIPAAVMSSDIVIPATRNLKAWKKDFHHYESTLSGIMGIGLFFFVLWVVDPPAGYNLNARVLPDNFILNVGESLAIALVSTYLVLFLFQRIQEKAELVVLMSVLLLLYAVSRQLHLSPLVVIAVFGLVVGNLNIFFRGPLRRLVKPDTFLEMKDALHELTSETSFIVRIFILVIFGASIVLISLVDWRFLLVCGAIVLAIYLVRWVLIRVFTGSNVYPQVWIAPRGLLTLLLFYAIPVSLQSDAYNPAVLLVVIIFTGLVMTAGKISHRLKKEEDKTWEEEQKAKTPVPDMSAPPLRPGASRLEERWVTRLHIMQYKLQRKITHHPLYIVQKRRLKRFIKVSLETLGVQLIFNPETKRFNRRLRNVISILRNPAQRVNIKKSADYQNLKKYVHRVIFGTDTLEGLLFDIGLFILIILSVIVVMLQSISELAPSWGQTLLVFDWIITILFTIEYALRIWTTQRSRKYIFSFYGMVDLLSILPLYLEIAFSGLYSLEIIRIIRLVRIFRVLKLIRFVSEANVIVRSLQASAKKIFVFLFFVLIVCSILGSVMYIIEGPENGFTNIPKGIYWAVVTLTTVGYGDIYPVTGLGRFVAMLLMIMGYGVIAVPTGLVAAGVMSEVSAMKKDKEDISAPGRTCSYCGLGGQPRDARYCNRCGARMEDLTQEPRDGPSSADT